MRDGLPVRIQTLVHTLIQTARIRGAWGPTIRTNKERKNSWRKIPIFFPSEKNNVSENWVSNVTLAPDKTTKWASPLFIISCFNKGSIRIGTP